MPAEQPGLIPNHLARLAEAVGLRTDDDLTTVVDQVLGLLRSQPRWLLVFDNAEDPGSLRPYLPGSGGHVLITTRRAGFTALSAVLDVDVLDRAESLALLHRRIPSLTDEQGRRLAGLLGDLFTTHPDQLPPALASTVKGPLNWADALGILVDCSLATPHRVTPAPEHGSWTGPPPTYKSTASPPQPASCTSGP